MLPKLRQTVVYNQSRLIPNVHSFICTQLEVDIDIFVGKFSKNLSRGHLD